VAEFEEEYWCCASVLSGGGFRELTAGTKESSLKAMWSAREQHERGPDGGPCSTLFIANLGPNCTEDELRQTFSVYPGFNMVKIHSRGGMPVTFADFDEVEQATKVMEQLQSSMLSSSDRGGMHIEYARSKMRKH
ncbi:hypothetical protein HN51_062088, partial [Arachis hypogaea]